jgi:protein-L-isoaspartate(D-aspartate) O-methyltransferase
MAKGHIALVNHLIKRGVLKTPSLIKVFKVVDRVNFVPKNARKRAYEDIPISLSTGSTVSQPYTLALMLELLQPQAGDTILDIGSGSGWSTTLLGKIVGRQGRVVGMEIKPELVALGQKNVAKYRLGKQVKLVQAQLGQLGLPQQFGVFNKILVSATTDSLPGQLLEQLTIPGRIVLPIGYSLWQIDKKATGELDRHEFPGFIFVPLIT